MSTIYYIVLIALALIGGLILFSKMSSNGKKLGDEETYKADQMAKEYVDWEDSPVRFEKKTIGEALDKAWEAFQDINTHDIIELATDTIGCQLSIDNNGSDPQILVAFAVKGDVLNYYYACQREKISFVLKSWIC